MLAVWPLRWRGGVSSLRSKTIRDKMLLDLSPAFVTMLVVANVFNYPLLQISPSCAEQIGRLWIEATPSGPLPSFRAGCIADKNTCVTSCN